LEAQERLRRIGLLRNLCAPLWSWRLLMRCKNRQRSPQRYAACCARTGDCGISQKVRKRIEQGLGWIKTFGGLRILPMVGVAAVRGWVTWAFAAYNLTRLGGIGDRLASLPT